MQFVFLFFDLEFWRTIQVQLQDALLETIKWTNFL